MAYHKNIDKGAVLRRIEAGERQADVARLLGCSEARISQIIKDAHLGICRGKRGRPACEPVARVSGPPGRPPICFVPVWAEEVAEDYHDFAREFGEFFAAQHCRRLLADARIARDRMGAPL